jgi:hypothetical protein
MACGLILRPAETFGVLSCFSGYALRLFAFVPWPFFGGALGFVGSLLEDVFNGDEEFCEVDGGPFRKAANKRLNHCQRLTF